MTPPLPTDYRSLKRALFACGSGMAKLARELNLTLPHVTLVAKGDRRSPRVEAAIAAKLGVEPAALFPDRYADAA